MKYVLVEVVGAGAGASAGAGAGAAAGDGAADNDTVALVVQHTVELGTC